MGKRGPKPGTGGRKPKPISEKIASGNPGKRPLKVIEFPEDEYFDDTEGVDMPTPSEYLSKEQRDGTELCAVEIYEYTYNWLKERGCIKLINPQLIERYAMVTARWIQCENLASEKGMLAKHPTTGAPMKSPFIAIADQYITQSNRLWDDIYQIVKENCTGEYGGVTPQDDAMEKLLMARSG